MHVSSIRRGYKDSVEKNNCGSKKNANRSLGASLSRSMVPHVAVLQGKADAKVNTILDSLIPVGKILRRSWTDIPAITTWFMNFNLSGEGTLF